MGICTRTHKGKEHTDSVCLEELPRGCTKDRKNKRAVQDLHTTTHQTSTDLNSPFFWLTCAITVRMLCAGRAWQRERPAWASESGKASRRRTHLHEEQGSDKTFRWMAVSSQSLNLSTSRHPFFFKKGAGDGGTAGRKGGEREKQNAW